MPEIQKADPQARRRAVLIFVGGTAIGAAVVSIALAYQSALLDWVNEDPAAMRFRTRLVLGIMGLLISGPLVVFGIYFWRLGNKVAAALRFPPPGVEVIRDTVILYDEAAKRRGRLLQLFGITLTVVACVMLALLWRIAELIR